MFSSWNPYQVTPLITPICASIPDLMISQQKYWYKTLFHMKNSETYETCVDTVLESRVTEWEVTQWDDGVWVTDSVSRVSHWVSDWHMTGVWLWHWQWEWHTDWGVRWVTDWVTQWDWLRMRFENEMWDWLWLWDRMTQSLNHCDSVTDSINGSIKIPLVFWEKNYSTWVTWSTTWFSHAVKR